MIVRVHEEGEISWVGDLDDLLEANHFLTGEQRERLRALEPGESVALEPGFLVEHPLRTEIPVIPGGGLTARQREIYEEVHDKLTEVKAEVDHALDRRRKPSSWEEQGVARAVADAAKDLLGFVTRLAAARDEVNE